MQKNFIILFFLVLSSSTINGQCNGLSIKSLPSGFAIDETGNRLLDSLMDSQFTRLENFFHLDLKLFYVEEKEGENAFYDRNGESIVIGRTLMSRCDYMTTIAVLAHEFGHALQHFYNWQESGKRPELHADFLSGYYIGNLSEQIKESELKKVMNKLFSIGDTHFFDPDHHGTGQERECAFYEGYYLAKKSKVSLEEACIYGFRYVEKDSPCLVQKYNRYESDILNGQKGEVRFKTTDNKSYIISYKDVDGVVKRYRMDKKNPIISIPNMSINFKIIFSIYEETTLAGLMFVNQLSIQPGQNLIMEINIDKWKINSRQYRIINDYTPVSSTSKNTFKFSSPDQEYYIFDAHDKYIGKISPGTDLNIFTQYYDFNYFNVYRFQKGKFYFEEEISNGLINVPQNGKTNVQISKKTGVKLSFIYP